MLPYQEFFYSIGDLPTSASPAEIRRVCPDGVRRQHAFKHSFDLYPGDVRYLEGYLAAQDIAIAVERLRFWLNNSRMPTVSDVVKNHPAFRHLFSPCQS